MWMKKKVRISRLLYSMTGNRAVTVRSALSGGTRPSLPPPPPSLAPGGRVRPSGGVQERALFLNKLLLEHGERRIMGGLHNI
jgi:hypothetical protein